MQEVRRRRTLRIARVGTRRHPMQEVRRHRTFRTGRVGTRRQRVQEVRRRRTFRTGRVGTRRQRMQEVRRHRTLRIARVGTRRHPMQEVRRRRTFRIARVGTRTEAVQEAGRRRSSRRNSRRACRGSLRARRERLLPGSVTRRRARRRAAKPRSRQGGLSAEPRARTWLLQIPGSLAAWRLPPTLPILLTAMPAPARAPERSTAAQWDSGTVGRPSGRGGGSGERCLRKNIRIFGSMVDRGVPLSRCPTWAVDLPGDRRGRSGSGSNAGGEQVSRRGVRITAPSRPGG
jgi:hypothetical protein